MSITILGKLPDPFRKDDGTRMTADEWYKARTQLFEKICNIEYGGIPPRPEIVKVTRLTAPRCDGGTNVYKIWAGTKERQLSFLLDITAPASPIDGSIKYPLLLTGDGCYTCCESDTIEKACSMKIAVARFNRLEFASDDKDAGRSGGLYDVYPESKSFTAISAWAWGYMAVMDALEQIPHIDIENVGITGHSRGGKTVMLAAAADTRIKFVCPNNSGCHGAVSYRLKETGYGLANKSEELSDMFRRFPHWMGESLRDYVDREDKLPYDMHFFGALIAPRYYMQCEGMQDYWINPKGAWMNFCGVKEAYRYLGCEDNVAAWFRPGVHRHKLPDFTQFLEFMQAKLQSLPTAEHLKIKESITNVGVIDRITDLFEGQYKIPDGIRYNSYLIEDEKVAVIDSVDARFADEWLANIDASLGGRAPDYLIIQHMEPDHSGSIAAFLAKYPSAALVSSAKAYGMMKSFYDISPLDGWLTVGDGDTLSLGAHELRFIAAPMVHWPEVIVTYDSLDKVLFSADGFGSFGTGDVSEVWDDEARRYYIGIVGKYGVPVTNLLKKASALDISVVAPLHGPVLTDNLSHYLSLYSAWASYTPEDKGVVIAYATVYGNTREAAELLRDELTSRGVTVSLFDLARCDKHAAVADAFRYSHLVLAAASYNADVFPPMREFISKLTERGYCRRTVGIIQNGSWAPSAAKAMRTLLEGAKDITFAECEVTVRSALNAESRADIARLADELCK